MYFNHSPTHHDGNMPEGRVSVHLVLTGRRSPEEQSGHQRVTTGGGVAGTVKPGAVGAHSLAPRGWGKGDLPTGSDVQADTCKTGRS